MVNLRVSHTLFYSPVKNKKIRRFILYFDKSVFFIMTCIFIFGYSKILYSPELIEKASTNSGLSLLELMFFMGVLLGIWCLFAFLLLVFVNYNEVENDKKDV